MAKGALISLMITTVLYFDAHRKCLELCLMPLFVALSPDDGCKISCYFKVILVEKSNVEEVGLFWFSLKLRVLANFPN